jgi:putative PEP-CTERM system histidine kinase
MSEINPYSIPPFISFALLLFCAIYIIKKGPRRIFNLLFGFAVFSLSAAELGNFIALASSSADGALFWQRRAFGAAAFLPVSWVGLSLIFARDNYRASLKKWLWYIWLNLLIALGFLFIHPGESLIKSVEGHYRFILGPLGRYFLVFFLLNAVFALLNFENTLSFSYGKHRTRIKWMVRGFSLYLWPYIILSSLALLFSIIDTRLIAIGSIAIVTGTLFCGYSVYRYGFVDVDVYVGRQAVYASATITIVGAYLFLVGLTAKLIMLWGVNVKSFFSFLSAFVVFFVFLCLAFSRNIKERLRVFIDRSIYKGKYDYRQEWAQISRKINSAFGLEGILSAVNQACVDSIGVKNASILLCNEERGYFYTAAVKTLNGAVSGDVKFDRESEFTDWLRRYGEPLIIKMFAEKPDTRGIYEKEKKNLEQLKAQVMVALAVKQRLIGFLCAGEKPSGEPFTGDDLELFKRIAEQAGVAILNARLSEDLILSKEMESFYKVSSFLIHDLKNFSSVLSMVAQNAKENFDKPEFQKDALAAISNTVGRMNELMQKLSILPRGLELKPGHADLNYAIAQALAKSRVEDIRQIRLVKELNGIPRVTADSEYIEKVFLNLILNAIEAMPEGGEIRISSRRDEKFVELILSDTGCGMTDEFIDKQLFKPFQSTKNKGLGIGLFQCKAIIEAHKGKMDVRSKPGEGTAFTIRLPIGQGL